MPSKKSAPKTAAESAVVKAKKAAAATTAKAAAKATTVKNPTGKQELPTKPNKTPKKQKVEKPAAASKKSKSSDTLASNTAGVTTEKPRKRKAEVGEAPARELKKARVAKPRVTKPKPKVVINHAPTTRLNVYVCGEGSSGELGLGSAKNAIDVKRPRLNAHLLADGVGVVQVAVGGMHCLALTSDNKILTWGVNDQGALGRDTTWDGGYKEINEDSNETDSDFDDGFALNPHESLPTAIPSEAFPEDTIFVEVAAGDSSSFALTDDGQVYGWGTFRVSQTMDACV